MSHPSISALILMAAISVAATLASPAAYGTDRQSHMENDVELDKLLTQQARKTLSRIRLVDGQSRSRNVRVSMDITQQVIRVWLDGSFLPEDYGPSFEDQRSIINNDLIYVAEKVAPVTTVEYFYDGKDIYHYFPEIKAADDAARERGQQRRRTRGGSGMAFVSAGHGYFYSHKSNAWTSSRDEHNGVSEGLLTPLYAAELKGIVEVRSRMPVIRPRVQDAGLIHPDSGFEWWTMAARYAIANQYPGETSIWNTYAGSPRWDREEREDINSRPKLANHLGAEMLIHLHSNADTNGTARGARVIVQPGRSDDESLARSVLCSMKELIQSQAGYESFVVASDPHKDNKGENREADMPSIIVETAFHTHPEDAKALLDPVFRTASMKGVEKGYRLWAAGRECAPFELGPIEDFALPIGGASDFTLSVKGNPQFPVTLETQVAGCSEQGACDAYTKVFDDPDVPMLVQTGCQGSGSGVADWSARMIDADGVATAPVTYRQVCGRG